MLRADHQDSAAHTVATDTKGFCFEGELVQAAGLWSVCVHASGLQLAALLSILEIQLIGRYVPQPLARYAFCWQHSS